MSVENFPAIMDITFRLIAQDVTVVIFCGVLLIVFLVGCFQTWSVKSWIYKTFKAANTVILRLSPEASQQTFYEHFDEIGREISEKSELSPFWREFIESTFLDEQNRQICLSTRPQGYFQKHTVVANRANLKQIQAVPNYLIGLGLFFTFLGLAAALHIAQEGLATNKPDALSDLLKVASVKFISSMVAILLSLALSIFQRYAFSRSQKAIAKFCDLLEERTEFIPSVKILSQSLHEQREQTKYQADMALNISVKLGEILAKSLPESVAKALEPLAQEIRDLAHKFNGGNENALQQMLQDFTSQLRQSAGQDMEALVNSVRTVNNSLDSLVQNLQGFSSNFGQDTQASTERLTACMQQLAENFTPVQQGIGQFGATLQQLQAVATQIQEAGGSISGAANTNRDTSQNLAQALGGMSEQIAPLQNALTELRQGMNTVASTAQSIEQVSANMNAASQDLKSSATEIGNSQRLLADKLQNFGQAAENIGTTVSTLKVASQKVEEALVPFTSASAGVTAAADAIKVTEGRIQEAQNQLKQTQADVQTTIAKIPEILAKYEERFGKVDQDMAKAFEKLAEGSGQFQQAVQTFVSELDKNFTQAVSGLSGAVQEMTDEREEFYAEQRSRA